jgi:hypothetical protein
MIVSSFVQLLSDDVVDTPSPFSLESCEALGDGWVARPAPAATHGQINQRYHLGGTLVPKAAIEQAGYFDEKLRYGEDWMLIVRPSVIARASLLIAYCIRCVACTAA